MALDNFSSFFDLLTLGAYRASPGGRLLRANMALASLHGFVSEAELLKAANAPGAPGYLLDERTAQFAALMSSTGKVTDFTAEIHRLKTREIIWVRQHAHAVTDYQGIVKYFEGTVEEISEPTLADPGHADLLMEQLSDKAMLLNAVVQTIPDLVWLKDAGGTYQACNAAFEHHFGHSAAQIIGKSDAHFPGNEVALRLARTDQSTLGSGQIASFEEELPSPGGMGITGMFEIIKTPMRNAVGQLIAELGMARNITDRKRSENQLRDVSEQFELALISAELGVWHRQWGLRNRCASRWTHGPAPSWACARRICKTAPPGRSGCTRMTCRRRYRRCIATWRIKRCFSKLNTARCITMAAGCGLAAGARWCKAA